MNNILIIGGTSGIGWALAQHYLLAGHNVHICGRDLSRQSNAEIADYTRLQRYQCDIGDPDALRTVFSLLNGIKLDLLIVCAGFYFSTRHHPLDATTTLRMLKTNVSGLSQAFELAAEKMLAQQSGHLVGISSVAGLLKDYPGASLYSGTKRSVLNLCDTYRIALAPFSINVTAIVPGYIDTAKLRELNHGDASHKPFILSESAAVTQITKAIAQQKLVYIFPWQMRLVIKLMNLLPRTLLAWR